MAWIVRLMTRHRQGCFREATVNLGDWWIALSAELVLVGLVSFKLIEFVILFHWQLETDPKINWSEIQLISEIVVVSKVVAKIQVVTKQLVPITKNSLKSTSYADQIPQIHHKDFNTNSVQHKRKKTSATFVNHRTRSSHLHADNSVKLSQFVKSVKKKNSISFVLQFIPVVYQSDSTLFEQSDRLIQLANRTLFMDYWNVSLSKTEKVV